MIWYKFHIGDYLTHTVHLSDAEDLAYRRLLDLYYMSEQEIPLNMDAVARKIRLDLDITESVLGEFLKRPQQGISTVVVMLKLQNINHKLQLTERLEKRRSSKKSYK